MSLNEMTNVQKISSVDLHEFAADSLNAVTTNLGSVGNSSLNSTSSSSSSSASSISLSPIYYPTNTNNNTIKMDNLETNNAANSKSVINEETSKTQQTDNCKTVNDTEFSNQKTNLSIQLQNEVNSHFIIFKKNKMNG